MVLITLISVGSIRECNLPNRIEVAAPDQRAWHQPIGFAALRTAICDDGHGQIWRFLRGDECTDTRIIARARPGPAGGTTNRVRVGPVVDTIDDEQTLKVRFEEVLVLEKRCIVGERIGRWRIANVAYLTDVILVIIVNVTVDTEAKTLRVTEAGWIPATSGFDKQPVWAARWMIRKSKPDVATGQQSAGCCRHSYKVTSFHCLISCAYSYKNW